MRVLVADAIDDEGINILKTCAEVDIKTGLKEEELVSIIYKWSEVEVSVWRLAAEIRKTQRRVNALENIFIPEYEGTVKAIEEILEESDREEFIRKKKVKSVLRRKRNP